MSKGSSNRTVKRKQYSKNFDLWLRNVKKRVRSLENDESERIGVEVALEGDDPEDGLKKVKKFVYKALGLTEAGVERARTL